MIDYSFVIKPNLPDKKVVHAVVSSQYTQVISALKDSDIVPVTVSSCESVLFPLRNHSDMIFSYLGNGKFIIEHSQQKLLNELTLYGLTCIDENIELKPEYPFDILLNSCIVGNYVFCSEKHTHELIMKSKSVINIKQGYAKCSCIPVDENSIITDDLSVYNSAIKFGFDALLVEKGQVCLEGFDTGFIGGCCGKINHDIIAFCGDIHNHSDYRQINSFLRERNVFPHSLFGGELIDIGSIIPITQSTEST